MANWNDALAPPAEEAEFDPGVLGVDRPPLASLSSRLGGQMLDGLVLMMAFVPMMIPFTVQAAEVESGEAAPSAALGFGALVGLLCFLGVLGYQAYLIATTGQSLGKKWVGTRIVRVDGAPVGFLHGVVLRSWVFALLTVIPGLGGLASLADALIIFGVERRTLHDRLANTVVVEARVAVAG